MSQFVSGKGDVKSVLSGDTFGAGAVLTIDGASTTGLHVTYWATDTSVILGVALSGASATGQAIDMLLAAPTAKCIANAAITAGDIVGPATDAAGRIATRANPGTVTTFMVPVIGVALAGASVTSEVIEVLLQPVSTRPSDG